MSGYKLINDPIHGHIRLDDFCIEVIDTAQFQRLRDLKQNGSAYFVFPGASHNRFEHSIGVSYLAGTLIERFQREQPDLEITESEVKCVKLAGLCHDLGHGPYSHIFDNEFMPQAKPELAWTHEKASEMMLEYLVDDNNIDLERDEVELIKSLIDGKPSSECRHSQRSFLFDIVANKRNSVDVDKFDYIERDCYNLGIKSSYDTSRLMSMSRVVDNQICFHHKEVYNIYDMFHTRYSLFKRIYTHKVGKAIEYMITDALLAADPHLDISDAVLRGDEYVNLTDDILRVIECSRGDELAPARAIIKRIRTRQLYKFVDEVLIPQEMKLHFTKDNINPREIIAYQDDNDQLGEHDVIIEWLRINYAMKDRNPVDMIRFYSKFNENESFHIAKEQVSYLVPEQFEETVVRVFSRDMKKVKAIQTSFRKLIKSFSQYGRVPASPYALNLTPNIAYTVPSDFESPRKRRYASPSLDYGESMAKKLIVKNW